MSRAIGQWILRPARMGALGLVTGFLVKMMDIHCYAQHFGVSLSDIFSQAGVWVVIGVAISLYSLDNNRNGQHISVLRRDAADLLHYRRSDKLRLRLELYQGLGSLCLPLPSHGLPGAADFAPRYLGAGPQAGGVRRVCGAEPAAGQLSPLLRSAPPGGAGVPAVLEEVGETGSPKIK